MSTTDRKQKRRLHRFTIAQYEKMGKAGVLSRADKVVLLDGLVVRKMTEGPRHATTKHRVQKALEAVLPAGWHVRVESPVVLPRPEHRPSEPEPDVVVVRGKLGDYEHRHPDPQDVALVVEVADSSLEEDREALARYAAHKIPCVWIVNLRNDTVEVYTGPSGPEHAIVPGYNKREVRVCEGAAILAVLLPEAAGAVYVADLFR